MIDAGQKDYSRRKRRWIHSLQSPFGMAAFALLAVLGAESKANAQQTPTRREQSTIGISDCGVHLIDHVILASDRLAIVGKIFVKEGDEVRAGDLVAQLRNEEQLAEEQRARLDADNDIVVRMATKNREVSQAELEMAKRANRNTTVLTDQEMLRVQLALDRASLEEEHAVHEQELKKRDHSIASARLNAHDFRSPIDGVIVRKFKSEAEALQQGEQLLEIVNIDRLKIEAFVPVSIASKLRVGNVVEVTPPPSSLPDATEMKPLTGTIQFIDVVAQPVTEEVRIWAEVDNSRHLLRPGLRAEMEVSTEAPNVTPVASSTSTHSSSASHAK